MKSVRIIESPSELGAGVCGSSLGVEAIKIAAITAGSDFFKTHGRVRIPHKNDLLLEGSDKEHAKFIEGITEIYERLSEAVKQTLEEGYFPFILTGDHSNAGGSIAGLKMAFPEDRIGVIWLDAHADLHTPYTSPSGNMHGMPLSTALGFDNVKSRENQPAEETRTYWNRMKNLGGIKPKILPEDLVIIGLRDYEEQEQEVISRHGIKTITTDETKKAGVRKICRETLQYLSACDRILVSFDVDSLDPSVSEGTGTPVPGGFGLEEATELLSCFLSDEHVQVFEVTEVNPLLDHRNRMAEIVFPLIQSLAGLVEG